MSTLTLSERPDAGANTPPAALVVRRTPRSEPVLHRGPFPDRPSVWTLEFAQGGPKAQLAGDATGASNADSESPLLLVDGLAEQIKYQLSHMRPRPETVLIGLQTDPFLPSPIVQAEVVKAIRVLADYHITSWLITRGQPLPAVLDALEAHRDHLRVTVALGTSDEAVLRAMEPHSASVAERLELIAELQHRQVSCEVNVEPLLPGLTDTREKLRDLIEHLVAAHARHVTAGYLVLRPGTRMALQHALGSEESVSAIVEAYDEGPVLRDGLGRRGQYLSKSRRQRGLAVLVALAAEYDIAVRVGRLSNPDFLPQRKPSAGQAAQLHHMIQTFRQSMAGPMPTAGV